MNNLPKFCDLDCPHCLANIEEYYDGKGCVWYECDVTGKMIEHMEECPEMKEEKDDNTSTV